MIHTINHITSSSLPDSIMCIDVVWPPINRTIVIEVDTNINFSADIRIGKEQPTAINYTDGCWNVAAPLIS
jgi:hypothetical protein